MDVYTFSLALGATGLAVMALGGLGHHTGHAGHTSHASGPTSALSGHGHHGMPASSSAHGAAHQGHAGTHVPSQGKLWALLSPRVCFSFLVGAGAAGLLLERWLFEPLVAAGALAGGVLFERYVVSPIWNGLLRFASEPAQTLDRAVFEVAQAVTDFNAEGQGLIALELDGQLVQVLGILRQEERSIGVQVRRGARVRIEEVDAVRNRCLVSSLSA